MRKREGNEAQTEQFSFPAYLGRLSFSNCFSPWRYKHSKFQYHKVKLYYCSFHFFHKEICTVLQQHTIVKDVSSCAANNYFSMRSKNQCQAKMMRIRWVSSFISVHRNKKSQAHSLIIADNNNLSKKQIILHKNYKIKKYCDTISSMLQKVDRYELNV